MWEANYIMRFDFVDRNGKEFELEAKPPDGQCGTKVGTSPVCGFGVIKCAKPSK